MKQKRWVLLELDIDIPEHEMAEILDEDITEYIKNELAWCRDSFDRMKILEITDEHDHMVVEE